MESIVELAGAYRERARSLITPISLSIAVYAIFLISGKREIPLPLFGRVEIAVVLAPVVFVAFVFFIYRSGLREEISRNKSGLLSLVLLYATFLPAVFIGDPTGYTIAKVAKLFSITLLGMVAQFVLIRNEKELGAFETALALGALVIAAAGQGSVIAKAAEGALVGSTRPSAFGSTYLSVARAALVFFLFAQTRVLLDRHLTKGMRIFYELLSVLSLWTLVSAGSRAGILSWMITFGILVFGLSKKTTAEKVKRYAIFVLLLIVLLKAPSLINNFMLVPEGSAARIEMTLAGEAGESGNARLAAWKASLVGATRNPFGVGWGRFPSHFEIWAGNVRIIYPHNLILEVVVEAGIVATLALLMFAALAFFRSYRSFRLRDGWPRALLLVLLVGFALNSLFSFDINGNRMFMALMALALNNIDHADPSVKRANAETDSAGS